MSDELVTLEYRFVLQNGAERVFTVRLRKPGLEAVLEPRDRWPDWTRLQNCQCPNCPLHPAQHPHCPVAMHLVDVIEFFKDSLSTEEAAITITSEVRQCHRRAPVQQGVSSLMGLVMATSGCPIMDKLRPMVHTHLPFATVEETTYRMVSMYLLAQYYRQVYGQPADWGLEKLVELFEDISKINQAFARRLVSINPRDASLNALSNLDCFAMVTAFAIQRDNLQELEALFRAYLKPQLPPS